MNYSVIKSRTFWTILAIFVVNGGNAIVPVLPADWQALATLVLGTLATYFHVDGVHRAAEISAAKGKPLSGQK